MTQVTHQICIGVRVTMREVNSVIIVIELHAERESVVVPGIFAFHAVLVVAYVATAAEPSFSTPFSLLLRVYHGAHPMIV
jgi:hypothetical protein